MRIIQHIKDVLQGKAKLLRPRSAKWPAVEHAHLRGEPCCQWCNGGERLQVHHILPFHERPELELDPSNLITLCEQKGLNCHLVHGHNGNFKLENPKIRAECEARHRAPFTH
jgi:5-methylcytosine-specific restriction endonuclease McrA